MKQKIKIALRVRYKDGAEELADISAKLYDEITHIELIKIELVNIVSKEITIQTITR